MLETSSLFEPVAQYGCVNRRQAFHRLRSESHLMDLLAFTQEIWFVPLYMVCRVFIIHFLSHFYNCSSFSNYLHLTTFWNCAETVLFRRNEHMLSVVATYCRNCTGRSQCRRKNVLYVLDLWFRWRYG